MGDGITDDTAAIQAAFDAESNVTFTASANYRITSQLYIDQPGNQTITGNDATLVMTSGQLTGYSTAAMVRVKKPSGVAYIDGLNLNSNNHASQGFNVQSSYEITNLDITNMRSLVGDTNIAGGIIVLLNQPTAANSVSFTNALIDNVNISNITAVPTSVSIASGDGNAKGIQIQIWQGTVNNDFTITNFTISDIWGDDADGLDVFQSDNHENWTGEALVQDGTISDCSRRLMKWTTPNALIERVTFNEPLDTDPGIYFTGSACCGISIFRTEAQTPPNREVIFRDITYNGQASNNLYNDFDFVVSSTQEFTLEGSTMVNARLMFRATSGNGNSYIIGNDWQDANSFVSDYDTGTLWLSGQGIYFANNTTNGATLNQLSDSGTTPAAPTSCFNGIQDGTETGIDCGGTCVSCVSTEPVTGVTVWPTSDEMEVADTRQAYFEISPQNATDKTGTWSSSNASVASVNSSTGLITGVGIGSCTITFTTNDGSFTDTVAVTVSASNSEDAILILGPQGYYTPTSGDADSWDDTSGFELHATEVGTITFTDEASFDGSSYYDLPLSDFLDYIPGTDEFTIIYREGDTAPTTSGYGISKLESATDGRQYGAFTYSGGTLNNFLAGTSSEAAFGVPSGNNRLVILVVEAAQVNAWVDGVRVVTNSTNIGTETAPAQSANIGGRSDGSYLINSGGTLDIVATIPRAITEAERLAIEAEFQVNGSSPVTDSSIKPRSAEGKPYFYTATTKKTLRKKNN